MIKNKIRSVAFLIVLIIIIAVVGVGLSFYVNYTKSNIYVIWKGDLFNSTVNVMISFAEKYWGGPWFVVDNETFYAIYNGRGGYDIMFINGTILTVEKGVLYDKFVLDSNISPPKEMVFIVLSNSTKFDGALITLFGFYWDSVPNPAQEAYEQARNESKSSYYGATIGMRGDNIYMYESSGYYISYIELGQHMFMRIFTANINASINQLHTFVSEVEYFLKSTLR
ncbi:MAG: hypothetical protein GU343_01440 [Nanoarchaeota archaeon]|jgi:hypothetical protein|nr:hypothetical protein [Nanoarchaeota archaeon]